MSDAAPSAMPPSETSDAPPPETLPDRPAWPVVAFLAVLYLAFYRITPLLPADGLTVILVTTVLSLVLIVWFTAQFATTFRSPGALALHVLLAGALVVPLRVLLAMRYPPAVWLFVRLPGLVDLLFVWFAASLGALLSFILRGANLIPPVAAVLALVDVWTVLYGGPVQKVMQSPSPAAQAVVRAMTVQLPAPAYGAAPIAFVGFADFLFIAFFVAAVCRFVPRRGVYVRMLGVLIAVLSIYMLAVLVTDVSLPALVPMAIVMIALHWRHFHYQRSEAFALLYAALCAAAVAGGFWYLSRSAPPPAAAGPGASPSAAPG